jgi:hypothetical protein
MYVSNCRHATAILHEFGEMMKAGVSFSLSEAFGPLLVSVGLLLSVVLTPVTSAQVAPGVQITPEQDAASVLEIEVLNAEPAADGAERVTLVFHNKKAVVYNLKFTPGSLAGVPDDTPLMPVMAKRDLKFDPVIVPAGAQQTILVSKVGLDTRTTEKLLLLDLLTHGGGDLR